MGQSNRRPRLRLSRGGAPEAGEEYAGEVLLVPGAPLARDTEAGPGLTRTFLLQTALGELRVIISHI